MSFDTEFDFWPEARLVALANCFSEKRADISKSGEDLRKALPSFKTDKAFWIDVVERVDLLSIADLDELPPFDPQAQIEVIAEELAEAVLSEMSGRDLICVCEGLYLGDLSGPESRLTMAILGIKGVLTVASHNIERLWAADGLQYHTAILHASSDVGSCLPKSVAFLERSRPAFVCCASGQGLSLLVCAAHLATSRPRDEAFAETPAEVLRALAARREVYELFSNAEREALADFCAARLPSLSVEPVSSPALLATGGAAGGELSPLTPVSRLVEGGALSALDLVGSPGKRTADEQQQPPKPKQAKARAPLSPGAKKLGQLEVPGGYPAWEFPSFGPASMSSSFDL